jgi:DNA-binding NarL/FixJ family response regulator
MLGTHGTLHELVGAARPDHLLAADPELDVAGDAGSVAEAMARIPAASPDVAVLDVRLPDGNGIELCRDLLSRTWSSGGRPPSLPARTASNIASSEA